MKRLKKQRGVFERPEGSGIWWIRYTDELGREHREKIGLYQTAGHVYRKRKVEIRERRFIPEDIRRKQASVAGLIKDRLDVAKTLRSYRTEKQRLCWWENRLGHRAARSIIANDIEQARLELLDECAPATVNRYLAALKATFSLAVRNRKADSNPVKTVKLLKENNRRVRWLSDAEESRLMGVLPKKYKPMVIVSLNTGLRKSEQLNLQWRDIDFRQGLIHVKNSKPGDSRYIPMNDAVVQTLKGLPRRIHSPFVFAGRKEGAHMNDLPKYWEEYLKKAKIENFHWHDLRHTFASRLVMAGADLYTVKKLLGHHEIKMTERYAHLAPDYLKGAVDLLTKKTGTKTGTKKN
ncbi:MAG: site-specific integrase [Terriglobia bacterium]